MKHANIRQVGSGYWKIISGPMSGLWLSRKQCGTDIDGSGIFEDVRLTASHPHDNGPAIKTFTSLKDAIAVI